MIRTLPIFKIVPVENEFTEIAIVDNPAIEDYFLKFADESIKLHFSADKQIISGPVMIPDKLIYRNDTLGERFVTYDSDGIKLAAAHFFKNGLKINSEHTDKHLPISIIESYFATEGNSFSAPIGSWIISAKVNDDSLWEDLKTSKRGFSFQSLFTNDIIGTKELQFNKKEYMNLKEKLSEAINAVLFPNTVESFAEPVVPVEAPVEAAVEAPVAVDVLTEEKVSEMINEAVLSATEQIMVAVQELVNQTAESKVAMAAMSIKLEEFSKQPISQPITEAVINTPADSTYSYLSGVKL